jgi:hypothetical protein
MKNNGEEWRRMDAADPDLDPNITLFFNPLEVL